MATADPVKFERPGPSQDEKEEKDKLDQLPNGLPNTKARNNMPGFMFETKYVMLNFMSLIPPDLLSGHITSSPESLTSAEISTTDNLAKSNPLTSSSGHSLRKSLSLDTGLHKSYPRLKHLHRIKTLQLSPASEDNLGYKYRVNYDRALSPEGNQTFHPEHDTLHTDEMEPKSPHDVDHSLSDIPRSTSPNKSSRGLYRMASDISSSGDFSYISDADDEDEDTSNASSLFSSRRGSITCRDGFLELRRSNHRLSTLRSQSEDSDDVDGWAPGISFIPRHSFDLQDVPEEKEMSISPQPIEEETMHCCESTGLESVRRPAADRSKLKLEIPCPPVQLSDVLVSLQSELNSEMSDLETEYEEVVKSARASLQGAMAMATPLTPQSQAAQVLAKIGDEVKYKYEQQITDAVNKYLIRQGGSTSYNLFKEVAQEMVDKSLPGWRQVALLLVFGQRVLWSTMQHGNKHVEQIIDYCSQLVSDVAAEFIIKEGGWRMESLFRKVRKNPQTVKTTKHSKLGEGWDENREAVTEGVTFYLKYLGSTLLDELPLGESYGEGVSTRAVQRIVDMAKSVAKRLVKVSLTVSPHGIQVADMETKKMMIDVTIYRISFCTADRNHNQVFAFMARNTINETMECHAFFCAKQKIAQAVTLSVSQAFQLAKDQWENAKNKKISSNQQNKKEQKQMENNQNQSSSAGFRKIQSAPQIDPLTDSHPRLPKPESTKSLSSPQRTNSPQNRQGWQTFDEENSNPVTFSNEPDIGGEADNLDDWFSQLAEDRSKKQSFPTFSTDLCKEDLDESVQDYLDGTKSLEAFSRSRSVEDLLNI